VLDLSRLLVDFRTHFKSLHFHFISLILLNKDSRHTSLANIVQDCQKFFRLLPLSNLIDIRTARFLEDVVINKNYVCKLNAYNVQYQSFQCIPMTYRLVIWAVLSVIRFSDDIAVYAPYVHLVKLNYLLLFSSSSYVMLPIWWNKDEYILYHIVIVSPRLRLCSMLCIEKSSISLA